MLCTEQRIERHTRTSTVLTGCLFRLAGLHIGKCVLDMSACPEQQSVANCLGPRNASAKPDKTAAATMPPLQLEPVFSARCDPLHFGGHGVT